MTAVPKINASTPFLQGTPNSIVSQEWYRYLNAIAVILGVNQDVITVGTFQEEVETARESRFFASDVRALQDRIVSLEALVKRRLIPDKKEDCFLVRKPSVQIPYEDPLIKHRTSSDSLRSRSSAIIDDSTTNATTYPVWSGGLAGNNPLKTSSSELTWNPSTGLLSAKQLQATSFFSLLAGNTNEVTTTATLISSGGGVPIYTLNTLSTQKIGLWTKFQVTIILSGLGTLAAGNLTIGTLPQGGATGELSACSIYVNSLDASAVSNVQAFVRHADGIITLQKYSAGTSTNLTLANITGTATIILSGVYKSDT